MYRWSRARVQATTRRRLEPSPFMRCIVPTRTASFADVAVSEETGMPAVFRAAAAWSAR